VEAGVIVVPSILHGKRQERFWFLRWNLPLLLLSRKLPPNHLFLFPGPCGCFCFIPHCFLTCWLRIRTGSHHHWRLGVVRAHSLWWLASYRGLWWKPAASRPYEARRENTTQALLQLVCATLVYPVITRYSVAREHPCAEPTRCGRVHVVMRSPIEQRNECLLMRWTRKETTHPPAGAQRSASYKYVCRNYNVPKRCKRCCSL